MHFPKRTVSRRLAAGLLLGTLAIATMAATAAAAPAAPPTVDEIVAHHVEARGGAARLHAISVLRRSGRMIVPGQNIELGLVEWKTRAGGYRQDVTLQGLTAIEACDGHEAWQVQPFAGRKDPSRMSADEARAISLGADLEFPFVDARAKGHAVESLGLEDIDGTPAHALRVHLKGGDEATYWIDPDTWMVIRVLERHTIRGAEDLTETDLGEYQQVAGVWVPMTEEAGAKGSDPTQREKFVYDKAEANVAVPAGLFSFPEAAKAATGARP
jgi:hypothetical protein